MPVSAATEVEDRTEAFYNREARAYRDATLHVDMSALYDRFLAWLRPRARILDAGSGSGRDSLAFLKRGYSVDAFDASPALCALSTALTGMPTKTSRFQDFQGRSQYDGIWACASLLHVPKSELVDAVARLISVLKPGGVFYMSFKHGTHEHVSGDGRYFIDMNASKLRALLSAFPSVTLVDLWISTGEGDLAGRGAWLNAIVQKTGDAE